MINKLLKMVCGKELILYNPHRNSEPLVNERNREEYIFFNPIYLWKLTGIAGRRTKLRSKLFYNILSLLNPVYIIDINWSDIRHSIYLVWCNNHNRSFVVVQHGIYHGGIVRQLSEKYVKCNIFLVWGGHFKKMYETNNRGKNFQCIPFGNPRYNMYDRANFSYKNNPGNRILIAVSVIQGERLKTLCRLLEKLDDFGFDVQVKEHAMQLQKASVSINGYPKVSGNLYRMLKNQEYDIIVTDVSSAMTDIIFFKNRALYFSPDEEGSDLNDNIYSDYLKNLVYHLEAIKSRQELLNFVNIQAQEKLLKYLIKTEDISNDLSQIEEYRNESNHSFNKDGTNRLEVKKHLNF